MPHRNTMDPKGSSPAVLPAVGLTALFVLAASQVLALALPMPQAWNFFGEGGAIERATLFAWARARLREGRRMPISREMMPITVSNSTRVNAVRGCG